MFDKEFNPVIRFMVVSDVHYKDEHTIERDRMKQAIETAYRLSSESNYTKLDAVYVVGDYANNGSPTQMQAFKKTLDECVKEGTVTNVLLASHEFGYDGPEGAKQRQREIFNQEPNTYNIINGFHFISVGCEKNCRFGDAERTFAIESLEKACRDSYEKPIFFFQHPHITDTVYGSICWGEDDLYDILVNYPQIIDFSGHSHAPVNDPRSIHQKHFTCLGTGTLSYFEGDEFDKCYGTVFPNAHTAAQMLIVEADKDNRVRIYPYDLISDNFFPYTWKIDYPSNPDTFIYTDDRYKSTIAPYFKEDSKIYVSICKGTLSVKFDQAVIDEDYVARYSLYIKNKCGNIIRCKNIWSEYYFYNMPDSLSVSFDDLKAGEYYVEIKAESFWKVKSSNVLKSDFFNLK